MSELLQVAAPRFATPRTPSRPTRGPIVARIAAALGQPFMPWQRYAADVAGEYNPDTGVPYYREADVSTPRQSGKTTWTLAEELERAMMRGRRQRITYTAQSGSDAREKLLEDQWPMIRDSALRAAIVPGGPDRSNGHEKLRFRNGSRIDLMSGTVDAGHGGTRDLAIVDELWHDEDDRRQQALDPSMATVADAQLIATSTMGTDRSTVWNAKVDAGRAYAAEGRTEGVCYFEWSVPEDADCYDEETWKLYMPALGRTITIAAVRHAADTMPESEFRRAYCNQRVMALTDRIIPSEIWDACCSTMAAPAAPLTFGLDVGRDRTSAAIAAGDGSTVELIDHREGVGWVVHRLVELTTRHGGTVALDSGGPAGSLATQITDAGVTVNALPGRAVIDSCARFYDDIADRRITIRVEPEWFPRLDAAVDGAAKKPVGDRWVWSRSTSRRDVTPLMAASLAHGAATGLGEQTYSHDTWRSAFGRTAPTGESA